MRAERDVPGDDAVAPGEEERGRKRERIERGRREGEPEQHGQHGLDERVRERIEQKLAGP